MKHYIKKEDLKVALYRLDWIKILDTAIKSRPTSWHKDAVVEWRNAGDTLCSAVRMAMEEKGILQSFAEDLGITPNEKKFKKIVRKRRGYGKA